MSDSEPQRPNNSPEFTAGVLRNVFALWFEPEIKRRQDAGALPKPFSLWAAQIIMEPDKPPVISFNDHIRGVLQARPDSDTPLPIEKGQELRLADLGEIVGMQLTTEDANAGHLTAIFHKATWYLMFDFRYNATRISLNLDVAHQFLAAAETAASKEHLNAAVENLFATVEIAAKSYLMMHPDPRLLGRIRHGFVATEFNRYGGKLANVEQSYVALFNTVTSVRTKARYPDQPLRTSASEISQWLATAKSMLTDLDARRPQLYTPC